MYGNAALTRSKRLESSELTTQGAFAVSELGPGHLKDGGRTWSIQKSHIKM